MNTFYLYYFYFPTFIILAALAIYNISKNGNGLGDGFWNDVEVFSAVALASLILSGIIFGLVTFSVRNNFEKYEAVYSSQELRALDTNEDIHGEMSMVFFVGSGYIAEDLYYHFFYDTSNGIKYQKVRADSYDFYLKETKGRPTFKKYGAFYHPKHMDSRFYDKYMINETKRVLEIPKGTVKANYKVN